MESNEKLLLLKKKLAEKIGKNESILLELKLLNNSFTKTNAKIESLILGIEEMGNAEKRKEMSKSLEELNENIKNISSLRITNIKDMPRPNVIMPSKIKIDNIKDAKQENVKIDWENMPKPKVKNKQKVEVEGLDKSLEKIIPKEELPNTATMEINNSDLWDSILINYPLEDIKVKIDRNNKDVIKKLTFTRG